MSDRTAGDRGVGDVEHREVRQLDEVDDVTAEDAGLAEDAVDQVADRATEQQPERQSPTAGCAAGGRPAG